MSSDTCPKKIIKNKQMSEAEKLQNFKIIQQMSKQINFKKNPRYEVVTVPLQINTLHLDEQQSKIFKATPEKIVFIDYHADHLYQIPLSIVNTSNRFQRIRIVPPQTSQFSITEIEYPDKSSGDIAPGLSVKMNVNFNASSLQDFDDLIQIITENDYMNICVVARKEQPQLNLQDTLVCPSTFLGDKSSVAFKVLNKGGGAGFKIFAEDGQVDENNRFVMNNFSIFPSEFYIQKNQSIQLNVVFHPKYEGKQESVITLACDNLTNAQYTLKGVANIVEFEVIGIDDQLFSKGDDLTTIFFQNGILNHPIKRQLVIKNLTLVKIHYHWDVHSDQESQFEVYDNPEIFKIEPNQGEFPPLSSITFDIYFSGIETIPYFQNLSMIIEDVPLESVKNVNQNLKDNKRSSLTYLSFQMVGLMQKNEIEVSPAFYAFPETLSILTNYSHSIYIKNQSQSEIKYEILLKNQSDIEFTYKIQELKGQINSLQNIEIIVEIQSTKVGKNQTLQFWIKFDSNDIKAFQIQANFTGPQLKIIEPLIDYGIVKQYSTNEKIITLENITSLECEVLCRNSKQDFSFDDPYIQNDSVEIKSHKRFKPIYFKLAPKEIRQIKFIFISQEKEIFNEYYEFLVRKGESHVLELFAEVQEIYVSLNRYQLKFKELYLNEKYQINKDSEQNIVLFNRGNIPTTFKWQSNEISALKYKFEPQSGEIQAKQKINITFQHSPLQGPNIDLIFKCDVDGLEHPLGINLLTKVLGLDVKFDLIQPQMIFQAQSILTNPNNTKRNQEQKVTPLELIDFTASIIKQISTVKFTITNTSGISTKFDMFIEKYEPESVKEEKKQKMLAKLNQTQKSQTKSSRFSADKTQTLPSQSNYKLDEKLPIAKQLEKNSNLYLSSNNGIALTCEPAFGNLPANKSVEIKVTLYNDICGLFNDNLCINIEGLAKTAIPIKAKVTGSPIMLAANQVGINLSGEYPTINIGTVVRGVGPILKNFNLINNGPSEAEIEIKLFNIEDDLYQGNDMFNIKFIEPQLGSEDVVKLDFEPIEPKSIENDENIQIIPQKTKIKGRSIEHFKVQFFCDIIRKFNYLVVLRPRLISDKSQNLGIVPVLLKAETILPQLSLDKKIDFNQNQTLKFQKWSYGESNKDFQQFYLLNDTQTNLIFQIDTQGPFKIVETSSNSVLKYDILGTSGMANKKVQTAFNLSSLSSVLLKIVFESDNDWPMNYRSYKNGSIQIQFQNGDKQSILLDGLLLRPNIKLNMSGYEQDQISETIDLSTVHVRNSKILSFYILNQTKVPAKWKLQQVKYPKNRQQGLVTKTLLEKEDELKTEDPSVFDFNITEGVLNGPSIPLQKIPIGQVFSTTITDQDNKEQMINPQEIKVRFTPKRSVLYKCKYRIIVEEGPYQDFILKGIGTLDEILEI